MAGDDNKRDSTTGNAPGGRGGPASALGNAPDVGGALSAVGGNPVGNITGGGDPNDKDRNAGFGLDNSKDVKGSLKVHIKLDLEADIRIIAKIKGDIAIGLL